MPELENAIDSKLFIKKESLEAAFSVRISETHDARIQLAYPIRLKVHWYRILTKLLQQNVSFYL